MKRIRNFILQLSAVLILFSGCSEKQMEEESTETSIISTVATNETQVNNDSADKEITVYPTPTQETISKEEQSATYEAFLTATNLMVSDLTLTDSGKYYYNDLIILSQDTEHLSMYTHLDTEPQINQGALYRTIAKYLDGYEMMLNNGKSYSDTLLGFEVSGTDFAPYAENAGKFISLEDSLFNVLTKFSQLESAEGNFDFVNNSFSFSVPDLTACAKEMMISEEMLGYIFAMLDEYAPTISFDGNSCYFEYEYPG